MLKQLDLSHNNLFGKIPAILGLSAPNLEILSLASCKLMGPIPESFGKLTRLQDLDLSNNRLVGNIPKSLTRSKILVKIKLYGNTLSGRLSSELGRHSPLKMNDISANQFFSEIPTSLCQQEMLQ